jgi:hypothetical protein
VSGFTGPPQEPPPHRLGNSRIDPVRSPDAARTPPPDEAPGAALAERWQGRADIVHVGSDVRFVAVMRLPGCPPPAILLAGTEEQLERQLTEQGETT